MVGVGVIVGVGVGVAVPTGVGVKVAAGIGVNVAGSATGAGVLVGVVTNATASVISDVGWLVSVVFV